MKILPFPVVRNVVHIPIDLIREDLVKIRTLYPEEALEELRDSVDSEGILQPVIVAPTDDDHYELVIGSRRLRAEKRRGSEAITAIVIEPKSPLNYILMALAENIHREALDPFEEARAYLRLLKEYDLGVAEIAESIKKGRNHITRRLQLLSLPDEVQALVADRKLNVEHATTLAIIPTGDEQVYWARRASTENLNAVELRKSIEKEGGRVKNDRPIGTISAGKLKARLELFLEWFDKAVTKLAVRRINADERAGLIRVLGKLEMALRAFRNTLEKDHSETKSATYGNDGSPRNAREVWPAGDVKKITAENRPSDEVLAKQLGRTVGAIRVMRSQVMSTKKRRHA